MFVAVIEILLFNRKNKQKKMKNMVPLWHHCDTTVKVVNPRRACAARVIVVVLCVCLSVCLSTTILALQATRRLMSDTNSFSAIYKGKKNNMAILLKRLRSRDMA